MPKFDDFYYDEDLGEYIEDDQYEDFEPIPRTKKYKPEVEKETTSDND